MSSGLEAELAAGRSDGLGPVPTGAPQNTMGTPFRGWSLVDSGRRERRVAWERTEPSPWGTDRRLGWKRMPADGSTKFAKSTRQFTPGHDDAHGSESGPDHKIVDEVECRTPNFAT